jgi:hypothetical protein
MHEFRETAVNPPHTRSAHAGPPDESRAQCRSAGRRPRPIPLREYIQGHFPQLAPEEQGKVLERLSPKWLREVLQSLPPEKHLAGLSGEQIRQYLERLEGARPAEPRKTRRKR